MQRLVTSILHPLAAPSGLRRAAASGLASEAITFPPIASHKADSDPCILQNRVVVYDGLCHLCHKGVKWVIKVDKDAKIKFCCLQSKAAEPYLVLCGVNREDVQRRMLFIEGPGGFYEGSTAALKVASHFPFPYAALTGLLFIPAPIRNAAYDYIAKRRYDWFGKSNECIVIREKELLERFIDRGEMLGGAND